MIGKTKAWLGCCFLLIGFSLAACIDTSPAGHESAVTDGNETIMVEADKTGNPEAVSEEVSAENAILRYEMNDLGAMTPVEALAYMQTAEHLVIIDVAATRWYQEQHFDGAINIPIEELDGNERNEQFINIPTGRPVILHCRRGVIVPHAYRKMKELCPDIPEISYIDGAPLFDKYNIWLAEQTVTE